ncbi:Protein CIA1 [Vitis vinifera]|uniref:Probable cytosolic iron-sulfur protein assembly protein CIAO1 homolog n=1 Tax=Vitis vinifera TaxID=29760 RepID=A0A438EK35_VITVI|nr:Protein CIA1 [Vitis vinifera]
MDFSEEGLELKEIQRLEGHNDKVWSLAWNPTSTLLASCSGDKTVRIWQRSPSTSSWHCKVSSFFFPQFGSSEYVGNVLVHWFYFGTKRDGSIRMLDSSQAVLEETHTRTVRSCAWSPSGKLLATASFDATTAIWELIGDDFECVSTLEGHENEVKSVSWNASGSLLATCSRDKSVWIWEVQPGNEFECVSVLQGHTQDVKMVQWHPIMDVLFSCSYDNTVKIWAEDGDSDDWHCVQTLANEAIDSLLKSNSCGLICKLDIEAAYDYSSKGLRQEDPFSSYFFVIVMETFNCLLKRAKVEGFLSGWQVRGNGRKGVDVSHLLFADDMLRVNLDKNKRKGGLGYGNLSLLNKAFLCKWSWCFAKQKGAFWRQVINRKYREEERGWCSSEVRGAYRVGLWKALKKEGDSLSCKITFLVRNGVLVEEIWNHSLEGGCWAPHFPRDDEILWTESKDVAFFVKTLYKVLEPGTNKCDLEFLGTVKGGFLCLRGYLEEGSNFGPYSEEKWHTSTVWALSFNPEGDKMVTCSDDLTVKIWDTDSITMQAGEGYAPWKHLCTLSGYHDRTIFSAHWSSCLHQGHLGSILVTIGYWFTGAMLFHFQSGIYWEGIIATGAADDAIRFFVESKDGLLSLFHQIFCNLPFLFTYHPNSSEQTPSKAKVDGPLYKLMLKKEQAHDMDINSVQWSSGENRLLASASDDGTIKIWELASIT